jgi:hypothetical protein
LMGDLHGTVPELTVRICWQPGPPISQWVGCNPDPDPKWQSGTVANTNYDAHDASEDSSDFGVAQCKPPVSLKQTEFSFKQFAK